MGPFCCNDFSIPRLILNEKLEYFSSLLISSPSRQPLTYKPLPLSCPSFLPPHASCNSVISMIGAFMCSAMLSEVLRYLSKGELTIVTMMSFFSNSDVFSMVEKHLNRSEGRLGWPWLYALKVPISLAMAKDIQRVQRKFCHSFPPSV